MFPILGSQGASYACFEKVNSPREKLASCDFKDSSPCGQKYVCKVWLFFWDPLLDKSQILNKNNYQIVW